MKDYPTWSQRKSWNNDGMDPDWKPDIDINKRDYAPGCAKCGMKLYEAMIKSWPNMKYKFSENTLPEFSNVKNVNIPLDNLKKFNAGYKEMSEFVAWVCGTTIENLNRADMIAYIISKQKESK